MARLFTFYIASLLLKPSTKAKPNFSNQDFRLLGSDCSSFISNVHLRRDPDNLIVAISESLIAPFLKPVPPADDHSLINAKCHEQPYVPNGRLNFYFASQC